MAPASASTRNAAPSAAGADKEADTSSISSTEVVIRQPAPFSSTVVHQCARTEEELRQAQEERQAEAVALSMAKGPPISY
eukprot:352536-Alexandrium_andersonii.AAC.1